MLSFWGCQLFKGAICRISTNFSVGGWLVLPASSDDVFYDHQAIDLWNQSRCRVGEGILSQSLDLTRAPENPELN